MEKDFLLPAFMAAESEINLIINDLIAQLHDKINELFQEPDERWVERIFAFSFDDEIKIEEGNDFDKKHLVAARKAKTFMYLQGLNAKSKLKKIGETQNGRCLGHVIAQIMNSPENEEYFKVITRDN